MAKDTYHDAVRRALEKEGWTVSDEQYKFTSGEANFEIDILAERLITAERGDEKIAVEVKSFRSQSPMNKFHEALGQYENYSMALEDINPPRDLYLAIPVSIWETFFRNHLFKRSFGEGN